MSIYNTIGISENDWYKSVRFPTSGRKINFYVLCGLPGTGKSTFAEKIKNSYSEGDAIILSRDVIRTNLLWDIRKEPKEIQQKTIHKLDKIVTEKMIDKINCTVRKQKYWGIIIDGCHTDWKTLSYILFCLESFENSNINLYIIGNDESICAYRVTNKKEGDYSDYKSDFSHDAIPSCVVERKRKELKKLLHDYLIHIYNYTDFIVFIPSFRK